MKFRERKEAQRLEVCGAGAQKFISYGGFPALSTTHETHTLVAALVAACIERTELICADAAAQDEPYHIRELTLGSILVLPLAR